ncbi:SPT2 chromatin protein-domain-containing protein, partial [Lipomyces arxii]|uniref:SPT2 chromatin protein-domain-containing protein n=1 Tax=Lipomyces arxii TaxID=56418 RepID=UPI0034CE0232
DRAKQIAHVEKLKAQRPGSLTGLVKTDESSKSSIVKKSSTNNVATQNALANRKKPNFLEILKKAEEVDAEKMKVTVKVRDSKKKSDFKGTSKPQLSNSLISKPASSMERAPPKSAEKQMADRRPVPIVDRRPLERPLPKPRVKEMGKVRDQVSNIRDSNPMTAKIEKVVKPIRAKGERKITQRQPSQSSTTLPTARSERVKPAPAPFAKPMAGLVKKRKVKYDSDSSLDDFIVDDEEEGDDDRSKGDKGYGYDREEIWNLFRRGQSSRSYDYDDEDDDMEVSGFDVFREEQRSTAAARKEDELEAERERRHAEEKRKRFKR